MFRVSAKTDYAVRAAIRLAQSESTRLVKSEVIARDEGIPLRFLLNILSELRRGGIVESQRGSEGGYQLVREPARVTVAEVIAAVGGGPMESSPPHGETDRGVHEIWGRASQTLQDLLQGVTLADLARQRHL